MVTRFRLLARLCRTGLVTRRVNVKYMNLEAETDWLARLWRSLGDARCAFVDLTDLTDNVVVEVELVTRRIRLGHTGRVGISVGGTRLSCSSSRTEVRTACPYAAGLPVDRQERIGMLKLLDTAPDPPDVASDRVEDSRIRGSGSHS